MLDILQRRLASANSLDEKNALLDALPSVDAFFKAHPELCLLSTHLIPEHSLALK